MNTDKIIEEMIKMTNIMIMIKMFNHIIFVLRKKVEKL